MCKPMVINRNVGYFASWNAALPSKTVPWKPCLRKCVVNKYGTSQTRLWMLPLAMFLGGQHQDDTITQ